ncbi:MAG: biopolymer transporter ExbD [Alphaproteobacteria bacterium]|nr:biopolymer transporter ExbD [Alphaproteobacteria bacterium]
MQFERTTKKPRQIGLTPLIDVVFLLIIFFMLSTSFVKTESMELSFPSGQEVKETPQKSIRVFIHDDHRMFLDSKEMIMPDLKAQLRLLLFKDPDRGILLLTGKKVSVQRLVSIMDDVYLMGGRNVSVAQWKSGGPAITSIANPQPIEETR